MGLDMGSVVDAVTDHPWIAAGAVVVGLFLLKGSGGGSASAAPDYSASLASMQIASDTNVALAGIQAQRDSVSLMAQRDIALGLITKNQSDRAVTASTAVAGMQSGVDISNNAVAAAVSSFQSALGFSAHLKDLELQRAGLDTTQSLGFADINLQRYSVEAGKDVAIKTIDTDSYLTQFMAPFTERMHRDDNATVRDLAWRQKQIAKYGYKANIFGNLISTVGDVAGQAMSMVGGGGLR